MTSSKVMSNDLASGPNINLPPRKNFCIIKKKLVRKLEQELLKDSTDTDYRYTSCHLINRSEIESEIINCLQGEAYKRKMYLLYNKDIT